MSCYAMKRQRSGRKKQAHVQNTIFICKSEIFFVDSREYPTSYSQPQYRLLSISNSAEVFIDILVGNVQWLSLQFGATAIGIKKSPPEAISPMLIENFPHTHFASNSKWAKSFLDSPPPEIKSRDKGCAFISTPVWKTQLHRERREETIYLLEKNKTFPENNLFPMFIGGKTTKWKSRLCLICLHILVLCHEISILNCRREKVFLYF